MISNLTQKTNYIISNSTFCLQSYQQRDKIHTAILDKYGQSTSPYKPLKIIRDTCRLHGSSYDASKYQARRFFGENKHKLPIMVAYDFGDPCILFPLFSPFSPQNVWLSLNPIINISEDGDKTLVTFVDNTEVSLDINMKSFNQQYVRAAMYYKYLLLQRNAIL
ncbi:competence protein ComK [Solibacillus sp. FSL R5-0691]|uniref:competence protein ComK n=1 Tax=Solibacillus sp. FSL R5-0691 TaxID=2921653 RepID=UPI0030D15783